MSRLKPLTALRKRNVFARFSKLRGPQRFAFTTTIALLVLATISVLSAHNGAAALADTAPATTNNPLPFVLGGSCPSTGILGTIVTPYCNATGSWLANGLSYAQHFFEILVGIEFAWSAILWALQKEQLGELLSSFILKIMGISFFFLFITNASTWLPAIMQSFVKLGGTVSGVTVSLDPDTILNLGLGLCREVFAAIPQPAWDTDAGFFLSKIGTLIQNDLTIAFFLAVAYVFGAIIDFVIFISFIIIAGQLIMTLIEMYIMIGGGAVMLGFTGSRWTMTFGEKYIGYSFSIGVKLFVNYLILALGLQLFTVPLTGCAASIGVSTCGDLATIHGIDLTQISQMGDLILADLSVAVTAVIFMMLSMRLPGLAASMMNGSPSLTLGAAASAASSVMGAVSSGIGAAVQTGTSSLDAVMGAATGVLDAGMSTVSELQDNMKEVAMMAVGGGMGGGAAAAGGGAGGGGMMNGGGMTGGGGGGLGGMMSGGGGGGGASGGGIGQMMGGGGGGGGQASGGGGSSSPIPGAELLDKNVGVVMGKGAMRAGSAVAGGAADLASSGVNGAAGLASAAASPLMNMDEGGGGGSVAIGLKLPD